MKAPDFALKNADEQIITLQEFLGKKVVVYFYQNRRKAPSFRYGDISRTLV